MSHGWTMLLMLLSMAVFSIAGSSHDSASGLAPSRRPQTWGIDVDADFVRNGLSERMKEPLRLIEQAAKLPSCARIATSALLHTCSHLERSIDHDSTLPPGSDLMLEDELSIYAARLAVCELSGADAASVPRPCLSFVPRPAGSRSKTFRGYFDKKGPTKPNIEHQYYDQVTEANLQHCHKSLASNSQTWTSYSNNRQNSVTMCHAMQSAVTRDEILHVANILANVATETAESFQDAIQKTEKFKQEYHELVVAMPKIQADLAAFDADERDRVRQFWDQQLEDWQSRFADLSSGIGNLNNGVMDTQEVVQRILDDNVPAIRFILEDTQGGLNQMSELVVANNELIGYYAERFQQELIERLGIAGNSLSEINTQMMPQVRDGMQSTIEQARVHHKENMARNQELEAVQDISIAKAHEILAISQAIPWFAIWDFLIHRVPTIVVLGILLWLCLSVLVACTSGNRWLGTVLFPFCFLLVASALHLKDAMTFELPYEYVSSATLHDRIACFLGGVCALAVVILLYKTITRIFQSPKVTDAYDPTSPPTGLRKWVTMFWSRVTPEKEPVYDLPRVKSIT